MDKDQVFEFVSQNKYPVLPGTEFQSRCISGKYHSPSYLSPLARPGADAGEIFTILATLRLLNCFLPQETVVETIIRVIGHEKKFSFHTDDHSPDGFLGCSHLKMIKLHYSEYGVTIDEVEFVFHTLEKFKRKKVNFTILKGFHNEKAVLEVNSLKFSLKNIMMAGSEMWQVFIYHKAFDEKRRAKIVFSLMSYLQHRVEENKLAQAYEKMAQNHFLKTISYLASGLPIYKVKIDDDGTVLVEEEIASGVLKDYM